jgi:dihydropteroate synthase
MPHERIADLAGVFVGGGRPVAIMGVINVSPESFHAGSVHCGADVLPIALAMVEAGASLIDVGARSTAPYLPTEVSEAEETERLVRAVELLAAKLPVPVSADTCRPAPARAALEAGARVINDVSTLRDPSVARLVASHGASLILMASPQPGDRGSAAGGRRPRAAAPRPPSPVVSIRRLLADGLRRARAGGIPQRRIVVDPGIGFFRGERLAWDEWDAQVLANLDSLGSLGRPLCVGVSRKSFIGAILDRPETADRLAGSLGATAIAVINGAVVIRTHDVAETRDVVRVAERVKQAGARR